MSGFKPPKVSGSGTVTKPKCIKLDQNHIEFNCPGCRTIHSIDLNKFIWNGSDTSPTISPSIRVVKSSHDVICHCSLKEGKLHFHNDSKHALSGQIVQLIGF